MLDRAGANLPPGAPWLAALLLVALVATAEAQAPAPPGPPLLGPGTPCTFTVTEPTQNTDGTPLSGPLLDYRFYLDPPATGPVIGVTVPAFTVLRSAMTITTLSPSGSTATASICANLPTLPSGTHTVSISVRDALGESQGSPPSAVCVSGSTFSGSLDGYLRLTLATTWTSSGRCAQDIPPGPVLTTVTFDTPPPPGASGALLGLYQGLDFAAGWRWTAAIPPLLTSNAIYFDVSAPSRPFTFTPGPRTLVRLTVLAFAAGTLTLSDDTGQTASQTLAQGAVFTLVTGWTRPSTVVTVTSSAGWSLVLDDIVFQ